MAESRKRPNVFDDEEAPTSDRQDQQHSPASAKRLKPAGAARPSFLPPAGSVSQALGSPRGKPASAANGSGSSTTNGGGAAAAPFDAAAMIAAKRAEIQAKLASFKPPGGVAHSASPGVRPASGAASPAPRGSSSASPAPVRGSASGLASPAPPASSSTTPAGGGAPDATSEIARKVAEAKRRVELMGQRAREQSLLRANPYLAHRSPAPSSSGAASPLPPTSSVGSPAPTLGVAASGEPGKGLAGMQLHPLLMDNNASASSSQNRYKPMAPKFATVKANQRASPAPTLLRQGKSESPAPVAPEESLADTPYYDPRLGYGSAGLAPKDRMGKGHARDRIKFNPRGKFVKQAEAQRQEDKMNELKQRILESARKAGLESELEERAKAVRRPPPPEIEWWDAPFLPAKDYESQTSEHLDASALISIYVQHPIQIPAPQDKLQAEAKPLFLTKKEMKRMRRLRRQADLQDKQDRQKMGLLPPDPPKVKISNMMRVLTQDAIADPTKVEAQVRREMLARERKHLKTNAERQLTDEQRREKAEQEKDKDASKGIHAMCFKIRYLVNPSHKFKVRKNAEQDGLSGLVAFNPKFSLVLVEGGQKGLRHYKKLMLNRIDWTEEATARGGPDAAEASAEPTATAAAAEGEEAPPSLADNTCELIWEGQHRERLFHGVRLVNCPSDAMGRQALGPKCENLWDLARTATDASADAY